MRTLSLLLIKLFLTASLLTASETLDELLDLRIKANEKYRDEYTEEAGEFSYAEKLQPLEKKLGQEWVDYLKYVKQQKDKKIKVYVIRLELLDEIASCYYDLEYAEDILEKASIKKDMIEWQKQLESLNKIVESDPDLKGQETK